MFDYRGWFVSPNTPVRIQLFANSVTSYAYDAADVMDDNRYVTFVMQIAQVNTKKVSELDNLVLAKKWGISTKNAVNTICHTSQHGVGTVLHPSLYGQFRTKDNQLEYRRLPHNV